MDLLLVYADNPEAYMDMPNLRASEGRFCTVDSTRRAT